MFIWKNEARRCVHAVSKFWAKIQDDPVLLDAGDGETTYILDDDKKMTPNYIPTDVVIVDLSVEDQDGSDSDLDFHRTI